MKSDNKNRKQKPNNGTLDNDQRMRILANLMIDKILEDYRNNSLKFVPKNTNI